MSILMDYHLIFMIVCIFLYLACIFIIFSKPDIHGYYLVVALASSNILFSYMTILGFFSIGLLGIDTGTGAASVTGFDEMAQFYGVFFGFSLINSGMIIYSFLNVFRLKSLELLHKENKAKWRDGFQKEL